MKSEFLSYRFPERATAAIAIEHVTVVPMDTERVLPDHTVVIEKGVVTRLAPSSEQATPTAPDTVVIDGTGLFLMPGLADMYTHYREPSESPLYLASGITTARTSGSLFPLAMEWSAARGEFPSPRVITVSPTLDGVGPTGRTDMPHGVPLTRPEDAKAIVREFVARGFHQITPFSLLSRDVLEAVCRAAADLGVRVAGNCPNALSWEQAMDAGMTGFHQFHIVARDHMDDAFGPQDYWDRFDPAPGTKLDFDKIRRLGGTLARRQGWSLPTVAFHQRASQPVEISLAHPSLRYVTRATVDDWESTIVRWSRRGRVDVAEWRRLARIRADNFKRIVGIFHEEGAPQLTCTDGVNPYNVQGDVLHQEIENFVDAGMSAYAALRCATAEAARYMNESDWGTVAVGKKADLILTRGNPLADVRATRDPQHVFVNGFHLTRRILDDLLEQRAELVAGTPPVAATDLPPPSGAEMVAEGSWTERICGADFGRFGYRHSKTADGGWLIEERHAGANPRRHPERRTTRLVLDADMKVRAADYEIESFVGTETARLAWSADEGYALRHRAVDGFESSRTLAGPPRLPSEKMAQTLVPRLAQTLGMTTAPSVDAEGPELTASETTFSTESPADGTAPREWKVLFARLGERIEQTFATDADGNLVGMKETTALLWPRELRPD